MADETKVEGISFDITANEQSATASLDAVIKKLKSLKSLVANDAIGNGLSSIGKALKKINGIGASDLNRITRLVSALSQLRGIGIPDNIAGNISAIADATKSISNEDISRIRRVAEAVGGFSSLQGVSGSAIKAASRAAGATTNSETETVLAGVSEAAQDATMDLEAFAKAKEAAFAEHMGINPDDIKNAQEQLENLKQMSQEQFFNKEQTHQESLQNMAYTGNLLPANVEPAIDFTDELIGRFKGLQAATQFDPFAQEKASLPGVIDMYNQLENIRSKPHNYGEDFVIPSPDGAANQQFVEFFRLQQAALPSLIDLWNQLKDPIDMNRQAMNEWAQSVVDAVKTSKAAVEQEQEKEEELLRIRRQLAETNIGGGDIPTGGSGGGGFAFLKDIGPMLTEAGAIIGTISAAFHKVGNVIRTKVIPAVKQFLSVVTSVAKTIGSGLFNFLTGGMQKFGSTLGNLMHQIGRVALFRLLRTAIKDLGTAFTEGINNMYQWSLTSDRIFSNAMDKIATASQYIKNSVAAMVSPFLESLAPVIDYIADKIVALFNLINQLFALLSGRGFWTRAVKSTKEYAKAAGSAAGSTGGLKKQLDLVLASFDELHLLAKSSSSGGGGGGGGGSGIPDYGAMFENVAFDKTLKDLIDSENWFGLGEYFADKLNVLTAAADKWLVNTFEPWAIKWATALGEIINGFVSKYNWELLGQTVADGMMAIVRAANAFLTTTKWLEVGRAIGRAVRSWFEHMSWDEVADFFANKLNAAINVAKGFVLTAMDDGTEFGLGVARIVKRWFENVDWYGVAITLEKGFNWAIDAFTAFVNSEEMWNEVKNALDTLFGVLDKIDFEKAGHSLGVAIQRILELVDWKKVGSAIGRFLAGIEWDEVLSDLKTALSDTLSGFIDEIGPTILAGLTGYDRRDNSYDPLPGIDLGIGSKMQSGGTIRDLWTKMFGGMNEDTESGLDKVKATADKKTKEIRTTIGDNITGGYKDAQVNVPNAVNQYNTTANNAVNTSGTFDIGKQTKEPVSDNLLSGVKDASSKAGSEVRNFTNNANANINTGGALDIGKQTKDPIAENFLSGIKKAKNENNNEILALVRSYGANIKSSKLSNVADDASSKIASSLSHSFDFTSSMLQKIQSWIRNVRANITGVLNNVNLGTPKANMPTYQASASQNGKTLSFHRAYVTPMAGGGPMDFGELYLAREDGPELVGRIGSQGAVVNNDQIVQAVSTGVAQAVAATLGAGSNNVHVELVGDARGLFRAVVKENNSTVARTGSSPLII